MIRTQGTLRDFESIGREFIAALTAREARWLTASQAADYLGLSLKRVHALTAPSTPNAERLPFAWLAGAKRFRRDELDAYLEARRG
jgi:Helix-turn-helix domain